MGLKLYFDKISEPSRALLMFVRANKSVLSCEEVPVALRKGEQFKDDYIKINPFKKVPVINHNGFVLTESVAILRYLCRTFPVPDHWYPSGDSRHMARIDEYMAWQHTTLRLQTFLYFRTTVLEPKKTGIPVTEKDSAFAETQFKSVLDQIEQIWLKPTSPFIAGGSKVTIADLLAVTELEQSRIAGYDLRNNENYPKIGKYMERIRLELNPHYDDAHEIVCKAEKAFLSQRGHNANSN